jgi:hypothetical protein
MHWRAGDWTKPPLDISLSPDGRIENVKVVFQDEVVAIAPDERQILNEPSAPGFPFFDLHEWPSDRYLDAHASVHYRRLDSGELLVTLQDAHPLRLLQLGKGLTLGFDSSDELACTLIGPLADDEWRLIEAAAT